MDLSNNSELLRYANSTMEEPDINEDSFFVVERETLNTENPPKDTPENVDERGHTIVEELAAASDTTVCHGSEGGSNLSVLPSGIDLENCSVEIERLTEENIALQGELKKQQGKMKEVMEQCREIGADAHRMRQEDNVKYEQSRTRIHDLEKENEALKMLVEELEVKLKDSTDKLNVLEAKMKENEFVAIVEHKDEQLAAERRQIEELQELLSLEKTQTSQLKDRLRELQSNASDSGQGSEKASIVELNKKIVENDEEIQTLRAQLESSLLQIANLNKEIDAKAIEMNAVVVQNEEVVIKNHVLGNKLAELEAQLKQITIAKEHFEGACTAYSDEIQRLQSTTNNSCSSMDALRGQLLTRDEQIQTLQVSLESSQVALEESNKWCDIIRGENAELKKTREGLLKEVEDLHSERVTRRSIDEEARREIDELRTENRTLTQRLRDRDVSFQELSVARQRLEEICRNYKQKNLALSEELEQLIKTGSSGVESEGVTRLQTEVARLDKENSQLKTQIAALLTENESIEHWKEQCDEYATEYRKAVSERATLETQLAAMNSHLEELQAKEANQQKELTDLHQTHLRLAQEHVNGEPAESFSSSGSAGGSEGRRNDDIIGQVINQFKRGMSSLFWDSDGDVSSSSSANPCQSASQPPENVPSASAPPRDPPAVAAINQNDYTELPPCPVCSRVFYSYDNLVKHCETCGENGSVLSSNSYGSHLDPFVFVPQQ